VTEGLENSFLGIHFSVPSRQDRVCRAATRLRVDLRAPAPGVPSTVACGRIAGKTRQAMRRH
jgi:hypothetical protein